MHKYKEFNFRNYKLKFSFMYEDPENVQYFINSFSIELQTEKSIYKFGISKSDNQNNTDNY